MKIDWNRDMTRKEVSNTFLLFGITALLQTICYIFETKQWVNIVLLFIGDLITIGYVISRSITENNND